MACQLDCSDMSMGCQDRCGQRGDFKSVCAKKIQSCCIQSEKMVANDLCSRRGSVIKLDSDSACVDKLVANNACINNLTLGNGSLQQCGKYRATVVYSAPTMYNLSDNLAFDVVLDDPNNNIALGLPWTSYTAPLAGYYFVTLEIDLSGFVIPSNPILGTPVANPQVNVNGVPFREGFTSFLSFHNGQHSLLSGLISLKAGDVVTSSYNALALSDTGFTILVGTAIASGNGTEAAQSVFKIHYLSSDCPEGQPSPCLPCAPKLECVPCSMCL